MQLTVAYRLPIICAAAGLAATLAAGSILAPLPAAWGIVDGTATTSVSLISLTYLVRLFRTYRPAPRSGVLLTVLLAVLKLPLLLLGVWIATRLASPGLYCFLASVGLVYSAFIWGVARDAQSD